MPAQSTAAPSSALAQQLSSISLAWARDHGGRGVPASATRRPSLLYDATAAADIELATVSEVGLSGKCGRKGKRSWERNGKKMRESERMGAACAGGGGGGSGGGSAVSKTEGSANCLRT